MVLLTILHWDQLQRGGQETMKWNKKMKNDDEEQKAAQGPQ